MSERGNVLSAERPTEMSYDWLAENGGPVCDKCDCDMELQPEAQDDRSVSKGANSEAPQRESNRHFPYAHRGCGRWATIAMEQQHLFVHGRLRRNHRQNRPWPARVTSPTITSRKAA